MEQNPDDLFFAAVKSKAAQQESKAELWLPVGVERSEAQPPSSEPALDEQAPIGDVAPNRSRADLAIGAVKTGVKWGVKAYLYVLLLMIAVLFVGGVLAAPFDALTGGGGPTTEECEHNGNC